MTRRQRARARELYAEARLEPGSTAQSFGEILDSLERERPPKAGKPLVLVTDEKREYLQAIHAHPLFRGQDEEHRLGHITVNSKLPRVFANPLFASNYLDREIRKDQAGHHRETTCFNRNVSNGMARLACYVVEHNYRKRYLIKARVGEDRVHAEVAGVPGERIRRELEAMFTTREFLTRIQLPPALERIWKKGFPTPLSARMDVIPGYAYG